MTTNILFFKFHKFQELNSIIYVQLKNGRIPLGRPRLRYKDVIANDLKKLCISRNDHSWKKDALNLNE